MPNANGEVSAHEGEQLPKYACPLCGSIEVLGPIDTYPIYVAEGDYLYFSHSEIADSDDLALSCRGCGEAIEIDDTSEEVFGPPRGLLS